MTRSFFPSYPSKPHASNQARVRINGKDVYLGLFGSPESKKKYAELAAQFAAQPDGKPISVPKGHVVTVDEVVIRWHAQAVIDRGADCKEIESVMSACNPMRRLFGTHAAADFDDQHLETVRAAMISGSWLNDEERAIRAKKKAEIGWCREHTNHQVGRIRTVWRWAERKRLVPRGSWGNLCTLPPIERFHKVRRATIRQAVDDAVVEETLKHVTPIIGAMLRVHLLIGCRPGELVRMQANEIEIGADGLGAYTFAEHKDAWRDGATKTIILPAEAVAILSPWLEAARRIGPDIPLWRHSRDPKKCYGVEGYYRHIVRACERNGIKPWYPYGIRHNFRRKVGRQFGIEGARAALGHKSIHMTAEYSKEQDLELARKVAKELKQDT